MTRRLVPVETEIGIARSRSAIFLDELVSDGFSLTLRGGLVASDFSESRGVQQEIPYRLRFDNILHLAMTTIDLHDPEGRQSCIDEDVESQLIDWLRQHDRENIIGRAEYHHWVVSTYDDIFEIVAREMTLELVRFREPHEDDWQAILGVANEALPQAPDGNAGWLAARQNFDSAKRRRHYAAEDRGQVIAYGAIEETGDAGRWRMFLVMSAARLADGLGGAMMAKLGDDLYVLGGTTVWMREQSDDAALLSFVRERGFAETRRFVVRDGSAYEGIEVVELERAVWRTRV